MIINSNDVLQRNILTNKCFYQTTAQIMRDFELKGYANSADETAKVIAAYHNMVQKKSKNNYSKDYNEAFSKIDNAIKSMANKVLITLIVHSKILTILMPLSDANVLKRTHYNTGC